MFGTGSKRGKALDDGTGGDAASYTSCDQVTELGSSCTCSDDTGSVVINCTSCSDMDYDGVDTCCELNGSSGFAEIIACVDEDDPTTPTTVATPVISPSGGVYTTPKTITMTTSTAGAVIHYTKSLTSAEPATPTCSSLVYGGSLDVTVNTKFRARACLGAYSSAPSSTVAYTIDLPNTKFVHEGPSIWGTMAGFYTIGSEYAAVAGIFDSDNKADIFVAENPISLDEARGLVSTGTTFNVITNAGVGYASLVMSSSNFFTPFVRGDFNNDGLDDVALVGRRSGCPAVLVKSMTGSVPWPNFSLVYETSSCVGAQYITDIMNQYCLGGVAGDFNGDSKDDIVIFSKDMATSNTDLHLMASIGTDFSDAVQKNTWPNTPDTMSSSYGGSYSSVFSDPLAGDFNSDGKLDIARFYRGGTGSAAGAYKILVFINSGSGNFTVNTSGLFSGVFSNASDVGQNKRIVVGDFTGDGKPDLAGVFNSSPFIRVWVNTGTGFNYQTGWWSSTDTAPALCYTIVADDFDGDTADDIACLDKNGSNTDMHVWLSRP